MLAALRARSSAPSSSSWSGRVLGGCGFSSTVEELAAATEAPACSFSCAWTGNATAAWALVRGTGLPCPPGRSCVGGQCLCTGCDASTSDSCSASGSRQCGSGAACRRWATMRLRSVCMQPRLAPHGRSGNTCEPGNTTAQCGGAGLACAPCPSGEACTAGVCTGCRDRGRLPRSSPARDVRRGRSLHGMRRREGRRLLGDHGHVACGGNAPVWRASAAMPACACATARRAPGAARARRARRARSPTAGRPGPRAWRAMPRTTPATAAGRATAGAARPAARAFAARRRLEVRRDLVPQWLLHWGPRSAHHPPVARGVRRPRLRPRGLLVHARDLRPPTSGCTCGATRPASSASAASTAPASATALRRLGCCSGNDREPGEHRRRVRQRRQRLRELSGRRELHGRGVHGVCCDVHHRRARSTCNARSTSACGYGGSKCACATPSPPTTAAGTATAGVAIGAPCGSGQQCVAGKSVLQRGLAPRAAARAAPRAN